MGTNKPLVDTLKYKSTVYSPKPSQFVHIRPLKSKAFDLPDPLKNLILGESDSLTRDEYFVKSDIWLKLIREVNR